MAEISSLQAVQESTSDLVAAAASFDDTALATVARELAALADVLADEPMLRRLLTEETTPTEAKVALASRVFADRVGAEAMDLFTAMLGRRWSGGRALVGGLRSLSRTAVFLRAERDGQLDAVEDQLFRFGRIVAASPELAMLLDNTSTVAEGRAALVAGLLEGKAHQLTIDLLTALARRTDGRSFVSGVDELVIQAAQRRDTVVATVTSAIELSDDERGRLETILGRIYARRVVIHTVVDAALQGGLRIRVGDEVIDGSVSGRLETIRGRLTR